MEEDGSTMVTIHCLIAYGVTKNTEKIITSIQRSPKSSVTAIDGFGEY